MPIRQQYFIAAAIIGLIAVMTLFAMFDYLSDRSRYAEQMEAQSLGATAPEPAPPYSGRAYLPNPGMAAAPMTGQNAGFDWFRRQEAQPARPARPGGILYCAVCDFAMPSRHSAAPNSIRCPRCPAYLISSVAAPNATAGR